MNTKKALEVLRKTHKWLCNIQDFDDYTNTVLGKVCPSGTNFTAHSSAIEELAKLEKRYNQLLNVVKEAEQWAKLTQTDCVPWLEKATDAIRGE